MSAAAKPTNGAVKNLTFKATLEKRLHANDESAHYCATVIPKTGSPWLAAEISVTANGRVFTSLKGGAEKRNIFVGMMTADADAFLTECVSSGASMIVCEIFCKLQWLCDQNATPVSSKASSVEPEIAPTTASSLEIQLAELKAQVAAMTASKPRDSRPRNENWKNKAHDDAKAPREPRQDGAVDANRPPRPPRQAHEPKQVGTDGALKHPRPDRRDRAPRQDGAVDANRPPRSAYRGRNPRAAPVNANATGVCPLEMTSAPAEAVDGHQLPEEDDHSSDSESCDAPLAGEAIVCWGDVPSDE